MSPNIHLGNNCYRRKCNFIRHSPLCKQSSKSQIVKYDTTHSVYHRCLYNVNPDLRMLMRTHHNGTCCGTIFYKLIPYVYHYADSSNNAEIYTLIKQFALINLWGLLIEYIEYLYAYFKTKSNIIQFNSGSGIYGIQQVRYRIYYFIHAIINTK